MRPSKAKAPTLAIEKELWAAGHEVVVGMDEVGRGAWAGPLAVGAAVLPRARRVNGVRDSKLLTETERERLFDRVAGWCEAWAVGLASQDECDELGMTAAQKLAARRALDGLGADPTRVLLDGAWDFVGLGTTTRVVKGDATVLSIAAASILAKVTRDRLMRAEAVHFPGYDFDSNKGYPCPYHKLALQAYGPTSIHRRTWVFMDHTPWGGRQLTVGQRGQLAESMSEELDLGAWGSGVGAHDPSTLSAPPVGQRSEGPWPGPAPKSPPQAVAAEVRESARPAPATGAVPSVGRAPARR